MKDIEKIDVIEQKRKGEIEILDTMIKLYCKKNHGGESLCDECKSVFDYAMLRINKCPHILTKTFCSSCKTHCYKPEMREKIKKIMKFSGPRMMLYHPVLVIRHIIDGIKSKI